MKFKNLLAVAAVAGVCAPVMAGVNTDFTTVATDALDSRLGGIDGNQRVEFMTVLPDTDGDGADEIWCAPRLGGGSPQGAALEVYEATDDNTYSRSWVWDGDSSTYWRSNVMTTADLDGNGTPEILMGVNSNATDVLAVFENVGDDTWDDTPNLYTWEDISGAAPAGTVDFVSIINAGDLDGDGADEVILCSTNTQDIIMIASVASGTFAADDVVWSNEFERNWEATDKGSPYAMAVGNIDNDTNTDIAVFCWDLLRVDIYESSAADTYALASSANLSDTDDYSWYAAEITDLDADGEGELWVLNISTGDLIAAEIADVSTVVAGDFATVFAKDDIAGETDGAGQINMDVGNQDNLDTPVDGADIYIVGGVDNAVINLEYAGTGDPLDSANWTRYAINVGSTLDGDTLWMVEAPETDLDGDNYPEIVFTRQDTDSGRADINSDKAEPNLFILEYVFTADAQAWELYR